MTARRKWADGPRPQASAVQPRTDAVLTIGLRPRDRASIPARVLGALGRTTCALEIEDLTPGLIGEAIVILSPLIGRGFDATDLAARLGREGFRGRYIAVEPEVPNPVAIMDEVASVAPTVHFDIVELRSGPRAA